jgi:site-specific recombinase XerC
MPVVELPRIPRQVDAALLRDSHPGCRGNVRDVQSLLGHARLETTMIYVYGDGERVRSPLDTLADLPVNVVPFQQAA